MKREVLTLALAGVTSADAAQSVTGMVRAWRGVVGKRIRIIALWRGCWEAGSPLQELCDEHLVMPARDVGCEEYFARLRELDAATGVDVIIPCDASELRMLQHSSGRLAQLGIKSAFPSAAAVERVARTNLCQLARELSVRVPETVAVNHASALVPALKRLGVPCVMRPVCGEGEVVQQLEAAREAFARHAALHQPVLVQESVTGDHFDIGVVRDAYGGSCTSVTSRKTLMTRRVDVWSGVTVDDPEVREFVERLLRGLSWHGPCGVEVARDTSGRLLLLDVQPLLPAWTHSVVRAGLNLPLSLFYLAMGRRLKPLSVACTGTYCVNHTTDLEDEMAYRSPVNSPSADAPRFNPSPVTLGAAPRHSSGALTHSW